ncbi:MAG: cysteine desulfurase [Nitrospinota bacterium]|nr:cysteine desulfurase [Nitrospinota bacterium]
MVPIYLDHNATTPVDEAVLKSMLPIYREVFGNPSSTHSQGRAARVHLDEAREQVAELIGAHPSEIVFTSGGTESDNLAIAGIARALRIKGNHILTSRVEHPAVLNTCAELEKDGFVIDYVPVDGYGRIDIAALQEMISDQTILITLQHGNSEVGTLQPIEDIGTIARGKGVLFHTDAVQTVSKVEIHVPNLPVDLLSLSAHKMYGPKGVGALYIRRGTPPLIPLLAGGGQEKKRRGGTENVPGIVGLGKSAEIARSRLKEDRAHLLRLRGRLRQQIDSKISGIHYYGHPEYHLPNTLYLGFDGVEGQALMIRLDLEGIAVSTGTACSSGSVSPSEVLGAMNIAQSEMFQTIRISLGRGNEMAEMDRVAKVLDVVVKDIRLKTGYSDRLAPK